MSILSREPTGDIELMLHDAHRLAQKLRQARFRAGALDLDVPEHKVLLDEAIGAVHDPEELDHLDDFLEVA